MREINTTKGSLPCEAEPDLWFSDLRRNKRQARSGCGACPLQIQCRDEAIERHRLTGEGEYGIWGGLDREQRKSLTEHRVPRRVPVASAA